jgi:hypothetical protein
MYYDRSGQAITEETWKAYWADPEYRILARTDVGEWTVAAWWAGVDDADEGRVFRTALLVTPRQGGTMSPLLQEWPHRTATEAQTHHDALVAQVQGGDVQSTPMAVATAETEHHCQCC